MRAFNAPKELCLCFVRRPGLRQPIICLIVIAFRAPHFCFRQGFYGSVNNINFLGFFCFLPNFYCLRLPENIAAAASNPFAVLIRN